MTAHLMTFLQAVAREEGFYALGTRSARNHNPGDMEYGSFAKMHGAIIGDPRFAVFPSDANGFAALHALFAVPAKFDATGKLVEGYLGATIEDAFNRYAPPVENETNRYIVHVCEWTGFDPKRVIDLAMLG